MNARAILEAIHSTHEDRGSRRVTPIKVRFLQLAYSNFQQGSGAATAQRSSLKIIDRGIMQPVAHLFGRQSLYIFTSSTIKFES